MNMYMCYFRTSQRKSLYFVTVKDPELIGTKHRELNIYNILRRD